MNRHQEKVDEIQATADYLREPAIELVGSDKVLKSVIDDNIAGLKRAAFFRANHKKWMSAGDIHGILKINQNIAKKYGKTLKQQQAIMDEMQNGTGMPKFTGDGLQQIEEKKWL